LRSIVLLEHDIAQSCAFFREGLGANVALATEGWAEIEVGVDGDDGGGTFEGARAREDGDRACVVRLHLKRRAAADAGDGTRIEETVRTGHPSSMLVFRVRDVQACLVKMMAHGGAMDGRIEYGLDGTTQAGVYTPGGTLLGLVSR
jgi:catechol 2,3-dioxygenase-like lactoylglutathione lyase family enzyme